MAEWSAYVLTSLSEATDDELDELVELLQSWHGVPSMLGGRLSVQLTVEVDDSAYRAQLNDAQVAAIAAVDIVAERAGLADLRVIAVTVADPAEVDRRLALDLTPPELLTTREAADLLGVSRQRVLQLVADHPDFPAPIARGARGLHHSRAALQRFLAGWDRTSGPRHPAGASS